ncbi:MAG: thioredoxin reductase [Eubacteriales bacterium]|nr:thioredoxin reductase [Eubacteriales bacterium]MDN5363843.1 thioredoxin reductase [Eubacteriales bacterium]
MSYDVIIIGGGPAGLTAGLYAGRANLKTALVERGMPGGQAATTEMIENYPGFPEGIMGPELMMRMADQARRFGVEFVTTNVERVREEDGRFILSCTDREMVGRALIIATGAEPKELGVKGERELRGRGVSYCATCDGAFFRDKKVAVVGGGDAAVEEALFLTKLVDKVYLIHRRDALRATKVLQERAFANPKIEFIWNTTVAEILGTDKVEALLLQDAKTGEKRSIAVDGIFIYIGMKPNTEFIRELARVDEGGYLITDDNLMTSIPGIFAAGDVRQKKLRQVITAAADGAMAAVAVEKYLEEKKMR